MGALWGAIGGIARAAAEGGGGSVGSSAAPELELVDRPAPELGALSFGALGFGTPGLDPLGCAALGRAANAGVGAVAAGAGWATSAMVAPHTAQKRAPKGPYPSQLPHATPTS